MKIPPLLWFLVAGAACTTLLVFLAFEFPGQLNNRDSQIDLTYSLILLAALGASAVFGRRFGKVPFMRHGLAWLGIGLAIFVGYSFRDEAGSVFNRLLGELVPGQAQVSGEDVIVRMSANGHFVVRAEVEGRPVTFLVDTGASDVVLSPEDARRIGIDLRSLTYSKIYQTANGTVKGAPVELRVISIGPLSVRNVRASVNSADMGGSLLGMSFLEKLSGFEVRRNSLILKP